MITVYKILLITLIVVCVVVWVVVAYLRYIFGGAGPQSDSDAR